MKPERKRILVPWEQFPRKGQWGFYDSCADPHVGLTIEADMTAFYHFCKREGIPIGAGLICLTARCANEVPEFRLRIDPATRQIYELTAPVAGYFVMGGGGVYNCTYTEYDTDFLQFTADCAADIAAAQRTADFSSKPWQDGDGVTISLVPWVHFQHMTHPVIAKYHSDPRFALGKIVERDGKKWIPVNLLVHHALMDGIHMGAYFDRICDYFARPETLL